MSLYNDLVLWESRLVELLEQTRELTTRVRQLEQQNQQLLESRMAQSYKIGGIDALRSLYDEGFHICHAHYAESREGEDCLFCLSLLHRGHESAAPSPGEQEAL